jgi:hypothetical protein
VEAAETGAADGLCGGRMDTAGSDFPFMKIEEACVFGMLERDFSIVYHQSDPASTVFTV